MKIANFDPRDSAPRNLMINSNLEFWQRGTNFTGLGANQVFNADRIQWAGGTLTATLSGARVAITGTNSSIIPTRKIPWAIRYGVSVAQPSLAAGASAAPWMKIEGYDIIPLAEAGNAGFTFSFYTRAFRPGLYNVQFANSAFTRNYATTFTISAADTWQRVVIFVPFLDVGNGAWNFTNSIGMYARIWMASGTTSLGATANVWFAGGGAQIVTGQVNAVQSTQDYLELTGFMLYPGQEEREFVTREDSFSKELALCQRYYEKSYDIDTPPGTATQVGSLYNSGVPASQTLRITGKYAVVKRATPTVTVYNPITGATGSVRSESGVNGVVSINNSGQSSFAITDSNTLVQQVWFMHFTADAEI